MWVCARKGWWSLILLVRFAKCFQPGAKRTPKMSHRDYLLPCATVQFYSPECTCFRQLIPPHAANTTTGIQFNTRNSHDHNQHGDLALCNWAEARLPHVEFKCWCPDVPSARTSRPISCSQEVWREECFHIKPTPLVNGSQNHHVLVCDICSYMNLLPVSLSRSFEVTMAKFKRKCTQ